MPADVETKMIMDRIDEAAKAGREESGHLHSRLNEIEQTTAAGFLKVGEKQADTAATLRMHMDATDRRIRAAGADIKEAREDRRSLWAMVGGSGVIGGVAGWLSKFFGGSASP